MPTLRQYATSAQLEEYITDKNFTVTDTEVANRHLSKAEELIDAYCGFWRKLDETMGVGGPIQLGLFPRDIDVDSNGNGFIPTAVNRATLAQAEYTLTAKINTDSGGDQITLGKVSIGNAGRQSSSSLPDLDSGLSLVAKRYLEAAGIVNRTGRYEPHPLIDGYTFGEI